jgi:hypothetical protein
MVESASKGAVLLWSKSLFDNSFTQAGLAPTPSALLAGALGGVTQTVVMGPCTFLVTGMVTSKDGLSLFQRISQVYQAKGQYLPLSPSGLGGFYAGGSAVAIRQATNWASREGITVYVRQTLRHRFHSDSNGLSRSDHSPAFRWGRNFGRCDWRHTVLLEPSV